METRLKSWNGECQATTSEVFEGGEAVEPLEMEEGGGN